MRSLLQGPVSPTSWVLTAVTSNEQDADEFAHNAHLPEWKQRCIRSYVDCQNEEWTGSCYDCLRYCEGQQEWPFNQCRKCKKVRP
jgi:hypothetical protein